MMMVIGVLLPSMRRELRVPLRIVGVSYPTCAKICGVEGGNRLLGGKLGRSGVVLARENSR